jgi:hypothetical protein
MENLTPNENAVLQAINASSGISAGQLGKQLGLDRNYARRVADRLIGFGHVMKRDNGLGFAFYPVNGGGSFGASAALAGHEGGWIGEPGAEGSFREVATQATVPAAATGRELVPAGQPYDSRTAAALRQHEAAKRRGDGYNGRGGHTLSQGLAATLGNLHVADPFGDETLVNLTGAINGATAAAHAIEQDRKAEQSKALVVTKSKSPEPTKTELVAMMLGSALKTFAVLSADSATRQQPSCAIAGKTKSSATENVIRSSEPDDESEWSDWRDPADESPAPDDFDDAEIEEIEERARAAVEDEDEQDTEPSPSSSPRRAGRVDPAQAVAAMPRHRAFSKRLKLAEARRRAALELVAELEPEPKRRKSLMDILKPRPKPEPESARAKSWLEKWFGTPRKAVWR